MSPTGQYVVQTPLLEEGASFVVDIPTTKEIRKVWYLFESTELPVKPEHHKNAFLLSLMHDCRYEPELQKLTIFAAESNACYLLEF